MPLDRERRPSEQSDLERTEAGDERSEGQGDGSVLGLDGREVVGMLGGDDPGESRDPVAIEFDDGVPVDGVVGHVPDRAAVPGVARQRGHDAGGDEEPDVRVGDRRVLENADDRPLGDRIEPVDRVADRQPQRLERRGTHEDSVPALRGPAGDHVEAARQCRVPGASDLDVEGRARPSGVDRGETVLDRDEPDVVGKEGPGVSAASAPGIG